MEGPVEFEPTTPGLKVSFGTCGAVRRRLSRIWEGNFRGGFVHRRLSSYAQVAVSVAVKWPSGVPALELCPRRSNSHREMRHATVFYNFGIWEPVRVVRLGWAGVNGG